MSNLSDFLPAGGGGGLVGQQSDYLAPVVPNSGSGQDTRYYDITVSAVGDVNKCICWMDGGFGANHVYTTTATIPNLRLTSATNLRISTGQPSGTSSLAGTWFIAEFA